MSNEIVSPVIQSYLKSRGFVNYEMTPIAGAGSGRQYFRISEGAKSCVLQISSEVNEEVSFKL